MQIQISWLLQKPTDLDLHCLQMQGISGFSRTRVKSKIKYTCNNCSRIHHSCGYDFQDLIQKIGALMKSHHLEIIKRNDIELYICISIGEKENRQDNLGVYISSGFLSLILSFFLLSFFLFVKFNFISFFLWVCVYKFWGGDEQYLVESHTQSSSILWHAATSDPNSELWL